jgi:hypothetical protein
VLQDRPVHDRDANPKWHVSDLLRGITPKSMLSEWMAIFSAHSPLHDRTHHRFVGYLERQAYERLWKARHMVTAERKQRVGIAQKAKTSNYTGP